VARTRRGHGGQATVEMAATLALLAVLAVAMVRVGVAIRDELAIELAAREGARAASVAADPSGAAEDAARRAVDLPIEVRAEVVGDVVRVHVSYTSPVASGLLRGIPDVTHRATASMALEPP
jgi:Flp pilus assembly protein TadG